MFVDQPSVTVYQPPMDAGQGACITQSLRFVQSEPVCFTDHRVPDYLDFGRIDRHGINRISIVGV